jgi:hypothetical protein
MLELTTKGKPAKFFEVQGKLNPDQKKFLFSHYGHEIFTKLQEKAVRMENEKAKPKSKSKSIDPTQVLIFPMTVDQSTMTGDSDYENKLAQKLEKL